MNIRKHFVDDGEFFKIAESFSFLMYFLFLYVYIYIYNIAIESKLIRDRSIIVCTTSILNSTFFQHFNFTQKYLCPSLL